MDANPRIQRLKRASRLGGRRFVELYGNPGNKTGRSRGGKVSWERRKADPELYKKYANIPLQPKESKELAEFIGIILGDGNITKFQCAIYLNSETDGEYSEFVVKLAKRLFGLNSTITKHRRDKVLRIVINSAELIRFLLSKGLILGNKVKKQVRAPCWIASNKTYSKACLRGLMDTDGCFAWHNYTVNSKKYSYPKIVFSNRSEGLLDFVRNALSSLGFHPKKTGHHQVWLYNKEEVLKYLKVVNTRNRKESFFKVSFTSSRIV